MHIVQIGMDEALKLEDTTKYDEFVSKFQPKKTTDDCYTPASIFDVILQWVAKEYGIDLERVIRPFYPGGDYEHMEYPPDGVVVDNPPFSILSQIVRFYIEHGIRFFLFAPALTALGTNDPTLTHICTGASITYENGATVNTSFLTNLDGKYEVRSCPELWRAVEKANKENQQQNKRHIPKYSYPINVLTAAQVNYYSAHDTQYNLPFGESTFIRRLDMQKRQDKTIFGGVAA